MLYKNSGSRPATCLRSVPYSELTRFCTVFVNVCSQVVSEFCGDPLSAQARNGIKNFLLFRSRRLGISLQIGN